MATTRPASPATQNPNEQQQQQQQGIVHQGKIYYRESALLFKNKWVQKFAELTTDCFLTIYTDPYKEKKTKIMYYIKYAQISTMRNKYLVVVPSPSAAVDPAIAKQISFKSFEIAIENPQDTAQSYIAITPKLLEWKTFLVREQAVESNSTSKMSLAANKIFTSQMESGSEFAPETIDSSIVPLSPIEWKGTQNILQRLHVRCEGLDR